MVAVQKTAPPWRPNASLVLASLLSFVSAYHVIFRAPAHQTELEFAKIPSDIRRTGSATPRGGETVHDSLPWPGRRLPRASPKNETCLIIMIVTCPYLKMLDNAVESLRGAANESALLALVPLDHTAKEVLEHMFARDLWIIILDVPPFANSTGVPKEAATIGTKAFRIITESRPIILKEILERYDSPILYCDIDIFFQKNPLKFFYRSAHELDFAAAQENNAIDTHADDLFSPESAFVFDVVAMLDEDADDRDKNSRDPTHVCSGFLYLQPTTRTMYFLNQWARDVASGEYKHDQLALYSTYWQIRERAKRMTLLKSQASRIFGVQEGAPEENVVADAIAMAQNVRIRLYRANNTFIPSGAVYEKSDETFRSGVYIAHNNWLSGFDQKLKRFRHEWGLWHLSGMLDGIKFHCRGAR